MPRRPEKAIMARQTVTSWRSSVAGGDFGGFKGFGIVHTGNVLSLSSSPFGELLMQEPVELIVVYDCTLFHISTRLLYRLDFCRRLRLVVPGCGHQRRIQGIVSAP